MRSRAATTDSTRIRLEVARRSRPRVCRCAAAVSTPTLTPLVKRSSLTSTGRLTRSPVDLGVPGDPPARPSIAAGANVNTLISGPNGSSMLGIYTCADGRQTMYQTFNENQYYLQSQLLRHGELDWLARNTYFGDQRNIWRPTSTTSSCRTTALHPGTGIGDELWTTTRPMRSGKRRLTSPPLLPGPRPTTSASTSCSTAAEAQYTADNGGSDPLLAAFQADKGDFGWISHT